MKKRVLVTAITSAIGLSSAGVGAATLQNGDKLSITPGVGWTASFTGTGTGSGFNLGFSVDLSEENGIIIGASDPADPGTGSHGGAPVPSDVGGVTEPWEFTFFGNTGYDYVRDVGITETTPGSGFLDMAGWTVTWNGVDPIPMGGCFLGDTANNGGFSGCDTDANGSNDVTDSGLATFVWDGNYGSGYTLDYTATVPAGDPSGFGGSGYVLHLEGTVSAVPVPAALWLFGSGLIGLVGVARRKKLPRNM